MSFNKVLIANRGEIALRLIKACKALSLQTVAIYSDADAMAPFVKAADEAVNIGLPEVSASYLDADKIIKAAKATGACAVHPGYGFLAENPEFAEKCTAAGLVFVGPSADVIRSMGSKIEAKKIAEAAGVPVVPGFHATEQDKSRLKQEAASIGAPLLIKASAGGGGRGMRLVRDLADFDGELELAAKEAEAAFSDSSVLLERYVENGRHVEVQILGDNAGNVVHLFDRDCSIQRHHQKIIEEAPAPNLPGTVREAMLAAAVNLARSVGYTSAGTVEYIYDTAREEFYFLEMNTRLQVEHPVTEMVTGIDIAKWQLRIALGDNLEFAQEDIRCTGWAVEARVAAENPAKGYMPETGLVSLYSEPEMEDVRVDSAIEQGSVITHYYDSMIAKVIAYGEDRGSSIRKLGVALQEFTLSGLTSNIAFLQDILREAEFASAVHHTNSLETFFDGGWKLKDPSDEEIALAGLAKLLATSKLKSFNPWNRLAGWRITSAIGREGQVIFMVGADRQLSIQGREGCYYVALDGNLILSLSDASLEGDHLTFKQGDIQSSARVYVSGHNVVLVHAGTTSEISIHTPDQILLNSSAGSSATGNQVVAPMPGLIVDILVTEGQDVVQGEPVMVLEAMKLLQNLEAPTSGKIQTIHCAAGDTPEKGTILITIEENE